MRREFIGPFSRYAIEVRADGTVSIFDAERTDAQGKATITCTAASRDAAIAWINAEIAADPTMQEADDA